MDKGYNRTQAMKEAKADACGTKEPGLHPVVEKEPRPLQPSDKRILLEKLCWIHGLPPKESLIWYELRSPAHALKKLEEEYGHKQKELEDWCGFTEYKRLWEQTRLEFIRKYYKGK